MIRVSDLSEEERAFYSIVGAIRFDSQAVAKRLRSGPLSLFESRILADLMDGNNPQGLRLELRGQGKGWIPMAESAAFWNRMMAIGQFVESELERGRDLDDAVHNATEKFGLSEATIFRDLRNFRQFKESEKGDDV